MKPIFLKGIRAMLKSGENRRQPFETLGIYLISQMLIQGSGIIGVKVTT